MQLTTIERIWIVLGCVSFRNIGYITMGESILHVTDITCNYRISPILNSFTLGNFWGSGQMPSYWYGKTWIMRPTHVNTLWIIVSINVNSLALEKIEWNFRYVIFKRILVIDGSGISCEIAVIWMTSLTIIDFTLVQVMTWCRQATSYYLSQCVDPVRCRHMVSLGQNELTIRMTQLL